MRSTSLLRLTEQGPEVLFSEVDVTESMFERMKGLLGHYPLSEQQGFWIEPCNSIHTWFMPFALDVVFVDRHKRVCHFSEAVKPWRCRASFRASAVLELKSGQIKRKNIQLGDQLQWQDG